MYGEEIQSHSRYVDGGIETSEFAAETCNLDHTSACGDACATCRTQSSQESTVPSDFEHDRNEEGTDHDIHVHVHVYTPQDISR